MEQDLILSVGLTWVAMLVLGVVAMFLFATGRRVIPQWLDAAFGFRARRWMMRLIGALAGADIRVVSVDGWTLLAEVSDVPIRIKPEGSATWRTILAMEVTTPRPSGLTIQRTAWADESEPAIRTTPEFSREVRVSGRVGEALALLSPAVRDEVARLLSVKGKLRHGAVTLHLRASKGTTLAAMRIRTAVSAARALVVPKNQLDAVEQRAFGDPDGGWRRRALEHLAVHAPERLLARREAVERELDPRVRSLANAIHTAASAEGLWLNLAATADASKDLRIEVLDKLADHGCTAALPLLVTLRKARAEDPDVREALDSAIFVLQSGVPAQSRGGLSLSTNAAGDLSLAEDRQGALSVAKKQDA